MMSDKEIVKVVQAYIDGKSIQSRKLNCDDDLWVNSAYNFQWNFGIYEYRIAPEPDPYSQEIFCYANGNIVLSHHKVVPPIRGRVVGVVGDGRVKFQASEYMTHYVYPDQIRDVK